MGYMYMHTSLVLDLRGWGEYRYPFSVAWKSLA